MKKSTVFLLTTLVVASSAVFADELHDKAMAATHDLQQAIDEMHVMTREHGPEFGGHMERAEKLAQQAANEREAALKFYRAHHPGWQ
jgi:hypothetical protein